MYLVLSQIFLLNVYLQGFMPLLWTFFYSAQAWSKFYWQIEINSIGSLANLLA